MILRAMMWVAAISIAGSVLVGSAAAARMSDREGQRFFGYGGPKIQPPRIAFNHPDIVDVFLEGTHVNVSPEALANKSGPKFLAKTTVNVITRQPLSEREIDTLAADVREQASFFHVVGVRFQLQSQAAGHYAWFLFWDGQKTIRNVMAAKEQLSAADEAITRSLLPGEQVIGKWTAANSLPGSYYLTVMGHRLWLGQTFSDGSGGDQRIRLRIAKDGLLVGLYSISNLGTYQTDGSDTDRISARLVGDQLHVSDNSDGRRPWFIGSPSSAISREILPITEPASAYGGFARKDVNSIQDALACVRKANDNRAISAGQLQLFLRKCFSKNDVGRFGTLAQIGARAGISCGASIKQSYRLSSAATEVIWAALLADENSHINARYESTSNSVARGSEKAKGYCADLLQRFGPSGTETSGLIEAP